MSDRFTIRKVDGPVVARIDGAVLAETTAALLLAEEGHDPVYYFPPDDAGLEFLDSSDTRTTCPHKGEATHYHIATESGRIRDGAWSYQDPKDDAAQIKGYVAFYPNKATVEEL